MHPPPQPPLSYCRILSASQEQEAQEAPILLRQLRREVIISTTYHGSSIPSFHLPGLRVLESRFYLPDADFYTCYGSHHLNLYRHGLPAPLKPP